MTDVKLTPAQQRRALTDIRSGSAFAIRGTSVYNSDGSSCGHEVARVVEQGLAELDSDDSAFFTQGFVLTGNGREVIANG